MKFPKIIVCSLFLLQGVLCSNIPEERFCPSPEDISPCRCNNWSFTIVYCTQIRDIEVLRQVFRNSEGYIYNEVHIEDSSLEYLPHDMFEKIPIYRLYLKNMTLTYLFDSPSETLEKLEFLYTEDTVFINGLRWDLLQHMTKLRELIIISTNSTGTLDEEFSLYISKTLKKIVFYLTEITVNPGALSEFVNLNMVAFDTCKLTELSRDIFPRPFHVSKLVLNNNRVTTISDDMFVDMPKLQFLDFSGNLISVIPEAAFGGLAKNFSYLGLDRNPIKCNCSLEWLIRDKPVEMSGKCTSPKRLYHRQLKDLEPGDLSC